MRAEILLFVACVALCVVGHAGILVSVVRSRGHVAEAPVPRPRLWVEVGWAVLPVIVLALVLYATWPRVRNATRSAPSAVVEKMA